MIGRFVMVWLAATATIAHAQTPSPALDQSVPRVVRFAGTLTDASGQPRTGAATLIVSLYAAEQGGTALWTDTVVVDLDANGRYTVLLGADTTDGLPAELFTGSAPRWVGVQPVGSAELPRVKLLSVPYALKAGDADTLGGRPLSAFMLNPNFGTTAGARSSNETAAPFGSLQAFNDNVAINFSSGVGLTINGPANHLALQDSAEASSPANWWFLYRNGGDGGLRFYRGGADRVVFGGTGNVGIGTGSPVAPLHIAASENHIVLQDTAEAASVANYWFLYRNGGDGALRFYRGGSDRLVLDGIGHVGIGAAPNTCCRLFVSETTSSAIAGVSSSGRAVEGDSASSFGVIGFSTSGVAAVAGESLGAALAGLFNGNVTVTGTLSKGGGSFKIDHPLDPANKYLSHSFVESPDMKNVYDGNVVLDAKGEATVALPDWFEALNKDFRYQLTALGAPGPNLYVADEIANNRFRIAGGTPGGKVSWQVTGIRQDAWANQNRIPVEQEKPADERGRYLHPAAFGLPPEMGITAVQAPLKPGSTRQQ